MTRHRLERVLWAAALLGFAKLLSGGVVSREPQDRHPWSFAAAPAWNRPDSVAIAEWTAGVISGDAFRVARRPTAVRFGAPPPDLAAPPRALPELIIRGVLGGPPWVAIVAGIPGRPGSRPVRAGQTIGDSIVVQVITWDSVTIAIADTTVVYSVRRSTP